MTFWPADVAGTVDFNYNGEVHKTWYRFNGDLKCGKTPLVVVHGGPGMPHPYMLAHLDIYTLYGRPVVFYDQIGNGNSSHNREKPESFWTVELFVAELENLVNALGIADNYDCLGHSWGGMLEMTLLCGGRAPGMRRVVIASGPASSALMEEGIQGLLKQLPKEVQEMLARHEREGTTDSREYLEGVLLFNSMFVSRMHPRPPEVERSIKMLRENSYVYKTV